MTMPLGGGYVEPFIFNAPLPWHHQDIRLIKKNIIRVPARSHDKLLYHRLHLSDVIATTGAAPAMPLAATGFTSNGLPQFLYYSPISVRRGLLPPVPTLSTIPFAREDNEIDVYEDYSSGSDVETFDISQHSINGKDVESVELDDSLSEGNTPQTSSEDDDEIELVENNMDLPSFYAQLSHRRVHSTYRPTKTRKAEVNKYNFGDGGSLDNLGIMALLRRKVNHVIVCINSKNGFKVSGDPVYTNNPAEDMALLMGPGHFRRYLVEKGIMEHATRKYFNYYPMQLKVYRKEFDFKVCHVLKDEDGELYRELIKDIHKKVVEGQPAIIEKTYEVVDNPYFGIKGGWQVNILWVYHCVNKHFEQRLPPETRELIRKKKTIFSNFPHFKTIYENKKSLIGLMLEQTQLLGHQGCFNFLEEQETIKTFFKKASNDGDVSTMNKENMEAPKPQLIQDEDVNNMNETSEDETGSLNNDDGFNEEQISDHVDFHEVKRMETNILVDSQET
eukprot:CAMPEP_0117421968 /NCGR_PEP_ID=MMETSP0758-20121206/2916_1 /TAXON_ID=63605 /ORGANISM="Percolomonas cosmopolitus, Strain AE-1 (ATCC 50343)" /LENGTH=502 /DNA_ID=CAMNT_0005204335 /DNA_START=643 /DNA_END=2147 /DNA_ORIENTATION=-